MSRETLIEEREGGVLTLAWNRPKQRNAFNARMYDEGREALEQALADDDVRAVVLTGTGKAFTAGTDLGEMASPGRPGDANANPFGRFIDTLLVFDKPLLAAVNGVGVGLGLTMLLHCDRVYIARGARLRAPFITLGVVPEAGSSYLLPAVIGWRNAIDLLLDGDFIAAERAVELGLADELCEPNALLPTAHDRARALAALPPGALRHTKRLLLATREAGVREARAREDAAFAVRVGAPENLEAIRAFFEKRPADFSQLPSS
jgi:enoyl-CoA hydratase/carnithine racemase